MLGSFKDILRYKIFIKQFYPMIIGINASFLRKADTGIGQVTRNFLEKLLKLKAQNEKLKADTKFILYLEEDVDLELPENFEKRIFLPSFYKRDDLVRKIIWEKCLLPKKVAEDGCDVFISMYQSATILKNRHIMLVHDTVWKIFPEYLDNWRKKIYYRLIDKAIGKADEIVTISENSKKDIIKFFEIPEDKIVVNYIDCDEIFKMSFRPEQILPEQNGRSGEIYNSNTDPSTVSCLAADKLGMTEVEKSAGSYLPNEINESSKNYIFYVGGFDIRKNVGRLIEAYGKAWEKWIGDKNNFPDLFLAGNFHPHLVPLVTDLPKKIEEVEKQFRVPSGKIKQLGFVKQEDLPELYKKARLFCYPSLYEGFGLPVLEAMNCGCPTVTSKVSSLTEIVSKEEAILIDPENIDEIADAIIQGISDQSLREKLIRNSFERAKNFDWKKFTEKMLNLIGQI